MQNSTVTFGKGKRLKEVKFVMGILIELYDKGKVVLGKNFASGKNSESKYQLI